MATSSGASALKCPTMLAAMRENDRRGRGVEPARHDDQVIGFVGMMPVQARMPVDEFESVWRPLRTARIQVVGIDKRPQRFGSEEKSAGKRAGIVGCGRHERRSGCFGNRAAIGWKSGQSKRDQSEHESAHTSIVRRFNSTQKSLPPRMSIGTDQTETKFRRTSS